MDSPVGIVPVSSVSLLPPPPPPKNAARMLALALAESAQQATILSQRRPSGPPTPVSPLKPQELAETLDWSSAPQPPQSQPSLEDAAVEAISEPPAPSISTEKLTRSDSLHLSKDSGIPIPCGSQDVVSSVTPGQSNVPSSQPCQVSETQKSPERQQPAVGQTPVSTTKTTATTPTINKDAFIQQLSPEVSSTILSNASLNANFACKSKLLWYRLKLVFKLEILL